MNWRRHLHMHGLRRDRGVQWWAHWRGRTIFKGWVSTRIRWAEACIAVGGEDDMLQLELACWLLGGAVGVAVPRAWLRPWVYERRQFGIRLGWGGTVADLLIAHDDSLDNMGDYYQRKRERGEPVSWTRAATWPGIRLGLSRYKAANFLLGKIEHTCRTVAVTETVVPMPERAYPCTVVLVERVNKRPRWKATRWRAADVEMQVPIPVPRKGEEDAIYAMTSPARSFAEAVGNVVEDALRDREKHGASIAWRPR